MSRRRPLAAAVAVAAALAVADAAAALGVSHAAAALGVAEPSPLGVTHAAAAVGGAVPAALDVALAAAEAVATAPVSPRDIRTSHVAGAVAAAALAVAVAAHAAGSAVAAARAAAGPPLQRRRGACSRLAGSTEVVRCDGSQAITGDWSNLDLRDSKFSYAYTEYEPSFEGSDLSGAGFRHAILYGEWGGGRGKEKTSFVGAKAVGADFSDAALSCAPPHLPASPCPPPPPPRPRCRTPTPPPSPSSDGVDFTNANLDDANFERAMLSSDIQFTDASLNNANFSSASVRGKRAVRKKGSTR